MTKASELNDSTLNRFPNLIRSRFRNEYKFEWSLPFRKRLIRCEYIYVHIYFKTKYVRLHNVQLLDD
jgi:hypothetical protein